ncbi:hypothetical protein ACWERV_07440 [Streptomyces sp. NPDC004031]
MGEARSADRHPAAPEWPGDAQPVRADTDTDAHGDGTRGAGDAAALDAPAPVPADRKRGLDLSVPQVAGSAVAAVVAAKLASNLGVYGTIVGAGVVSALGTCGGSVLQYVFRHTGRRVQEAAVQAGPAARRALTWTDVSHRATTTLPREDLDRTAVSPASPVSDHNRDPDRTPEATDAHDGYGAATSYRAGRRRGWRRPVVAVALAFGLTMAGITGYEAIAGENLSGHGGTTIGNAFTGGGHGSGHSGGGGGSGTDTPSAPTDREQPDTPHPTGTAPGEGHVTPRPDPSATTPQPNPTAPTTPDPATPTSPAPTTQPPTSPTPTPTPTDGGGSQ